MASTAVAGAESVAKTVEELSAGGSSPPERYILKDGIGGTEFPVMDVPVIDLALLSSSSPQELDRLGQALNFCGYVQVNYTLLMSHYFYICAYISNIYILIDSILVGSESWHRRVIVGGGAWCD